MLGEPTTQGSNRAPTAGANRQGATRDVIDEESLRALASKASQQAATHGSKTQPLDAPRPSTESSLLTSSILISDGDKFTIVPIGSVLHLPTNLRSRVIARPQGDILMWPDFLQKNTAWITAKEVPLPVSRGEMKAPAALIREFSNEVRIVVAVYHGCPITMLEPASNNAPQTPKAADRR